MQRDWLLEEPDDSLPTQPASKRVVPIGPRLDIDDHKCHVIVVHSLSGGTGKTMIATNVAAALQQKGERVLLVDCSLQSGDVGVFLNIANNLVTMPDLTERIDNLDREYVNQALIVHESGVSVLLAPRTPQDSETIRPENLIKLIERLREDFDFLVVDTASQIDDLTQSLFGIADYILHICNPTLPCVKNTRTMFDLLDAFHYAQNKSQLVMNRMNSALEKARIAISVAAIENHLKRKALAVIPTDERRVAAAINRGMTVISKDKSTSPTKELIELADALYLLCKGAKTS